MKRIIYLLSLVLFAVNAAWADDISVEQAIGIAQQFANHDATAGARRRVTGKSLNPRLVHTVKSKSLQKDNVYVINLGADQGYVIVSGDDRADAEILGYCDHGSFDYAKAPVQLKSLLNIYSAGIDSLRSNRNATLHTVRAKAPSADMLGEIVVEPLIKTKWNQEWPYNLLCPENCPTGCTNTALAQIMYYYRWPEKAHLYSRYGGQWGAETEYDWDNMKLGYGWDTTEEEHMAVAELMADIGRANNTDYKPQPEGSSAAPHIDNLAEVFNYNPRAQILPYESLQDCADDIKLMLDSKCPVYYQASNGIGGHALVCDGYTKNNYFSFNFGWGGASDGYYKLGSVKGFNYEIWILKDFKPYPHKRLDIDGIRYECREDGEASLMQLAAEEIQNPDLVIPDELELEGRRYKLTGIYDNAFKGVYPGFNSVTINNNIRSISERAFVGTGIKKLVLGNSVETIGDFAFWSSGIEELAIGPSPLHIGKQAFMGCTFNSVSSLSSAIDVDEMGFYSCGVKGDMSWIKSIRSVGKKAFAGARFNGSGDACFDNLEQMADSAFYGIGGDARFVLGPRLRTLPPSAIQVTNLKRIYIDEANPYYTCDAQGNVYTKNFSTLVSYNPVDVYGMLDPKVVRLGTSSLPGLYYYTHGRYDLHIPKNVQDVTDAFRSCDRALSINSHAAVPPEATDASFNDKLLERDENGHYVPLYVPTGCTNAYANAPGWRRFRGRIYEEDFENTPFYSEEEATLPPVEREYYMVAHSSDLEGGSIMIPVSKVQDISVIEDAGSQQMRVRHSLGNDILNVDSITWQPGFLYGLDYVSEVGEDKLEAYGRTSKITFDATVFSENTQVSIRESVLAPTSIPGAVSGNVVSIELANGEHQLDGTACISIDLPCDDKHIPVAAYFNKETGKWEPIAHVYNKETQQMEIHTSHLSEFGAFIIDLEYSVKANFKPMYEYLAPYGIYDFYETVANIEGLCLSEENQTVFDQFKDDESLWQQLWIDGGYTTASAFLGESPLMETLKGFVGNFGTIISVVDLLHADYTGDRQTVLDKSLGLVLGQAQNLAGTLFGTPVLTASMGIVGLVGVALNKFGTIVQESREDLFRHAMKVYYSKGKSGTVHYRSARDWYRIMLPIFREPKTQKELNDTIDKVVCDYCYDVWKSENNDDWNECLSEAMNEGWKADGGLTSAVRDKLSQEMRSELYNGVLVPVFQAVFNKITEENEDRALAVQNRYVKFMNRPIVIRFKDSSCPLDEKSRFAGLKLRMVGAPETGDEADGWTTTVGEDGSCVFQLSTIAYIKNQLPGQFALQKANGDEVAAYDFKFPDHLGADQITIDIDLHTQGVIPEKPVLKGLNMEFTPSLVYFPYETVGPIYDDDGEFVIEFSRTLYPLTRLVVNEKLVGTDWPGRTADEWEQVYKEFETYFGPEKREDLFAHHFASNPHVGIQQYFAQHDDIRIDAEVGAVYIGPDLVGTYDVASGMGSGKLKITNQYSFVEHKQEEYLANTHLVLGDTMLEEDVPFFKGQMKYDLEGTFTVEYNSEEDAYQVYFEADGTYLLSLTHASSVRLDHIVKLQDERGAYQYVTIKGVSTDDLNGKVKLKCTRMLQTTEQQQNN